MDNNLPNMDNDPMPLGLDSSKGSLSANPSPNEDLGNLTSQEPLHIPHKHAWHILKKLRREKTKKSQMHPRAEMAKSQT
jgi:hypothetical protein